ncbi:hypothetical protein TNCV_3187031 [Trichonephila clavipes]|nr:hypothetical protein TNCV_3187031 [Trichonephila clavipes]
MAPRLLTPDQKVACSDHVRVTNEGRKIRSEHLEYLRDHAKTIGQVMRMANELAIHLPASTPRQLKTWRLNRFKPTTRRGFSGMRTQAHDSTTTTQQGQSNLVDMVMNT